MAGRRKAGAQTGNKNAEKHGFYSASLSDHAKKILRRAAAVDPAELKQEIALLRARIATLLEAEPDNLQVLILALRQLTKMIAINYGLSASDQDEVHESLRKLIFDLAPNAD